MNYTSMEMASIEKLFKERRSVRKWQEKKVPEELVLKALEMGSWAPSGGGRQPYHFYVIANPDVIRKMADAVQETTDFLVTLPSAHADQSAIERWQKNSAFFREAPLLIAVCTDVYESMADLILADNAGNPAADKIREWRKTASSRLQSAAAVITQTLLALHAMGLGAVWMSGPVQAKESIEKLLGVPQNEDFVAVLPVGYPDQDPKAPPHKSMEELVTFIR